MGENMKFDNEEAKKAGVFVSAGRGQGKSNLVMCFADRLLKEGALIKAFDPSQAWLNSTLPYYQIVEEGKPIKNVDNCVYDLSRLYPERAKEIIRQIAKEDFERQVRTPEDQRKWRFHIYEESQMLIPSGSLRANESQEILRWITCGRNFKLSYILLTQRPAMIASTAISLCGQLYLGFHHEENDLAKLRNWLGERTKELQDLSVGEFLYNQGKTTERIKAPLFIASKPKPIYAPKPITTHIESVTIGNTSPSPKTSEAKLGALITWIAWISFMAWLMLR